MILCDTHIHVVGDAARYPMLPSRTYTPPVATIESLQALAAPHGITRFVVVQPSFYGTDNTVTAEALDKLGANGAGVAVVDPATVTEDELARLARCRVRGLRINLYSTHGIAPPQSLPERFAATASLAARMAWHVQVIADISVLAQHAEMLATAAVPIVIDHYGLPVGRTPGSHEGTSLLDLLQREHVWVKLSAPYRSTGDALAVNPDPAWLHALLDAAPRRCVWGSDWPHTPPHEVQPGNAASLPYRPLEYQDVVTGFRTALPDQATADRVMGANPARLYRFED